MKKVFIHILLIVALGTLPSCYGYRQVGLLQEREDLPQYDSAAYEPYRLQVNDEIIYRVVTMDETIAKTLSVPSARTPFSANAPILQAQSQLKAAGLYS